MERVQKMQHRVEASSQRTIEFTINGQPYTVTEDVPPRTPLNTFIREYAKLPGTKAMCLEGGCGACIVSAEVTGKTMSVNSCLVPILICNGWAITTIEGLGNKKDGYHTLQAALAGKNGSQCGYCSPGMVMNMYSLIHDKNQTMKEIENSFGSNICRCTGYRPILEAFKAYAIDAPKNLVQDIHDIEELFDIKTCKRIGQICRKNCHASEETAECDIEMCVGSSQFRKVRSVQEVFTVFHNNPTASYIIHGGNTAQGVYRLEYTPDISIDVNDVLDLHKIDKDDDSLTLGANCSLNVAMNTFEKYSKDKNFEYLQHLAKHIDLIASVPVRNIGSMAGNLMTKYAHHEFPSDLFLILETAGAQLHIVEASGNKSSMNFFEFLNFDMKHKLLYSVVLPALGKEYEYRSYKVMPRAQNAHAHVNAGFLFKLDGTGKVLQKPNVIMGGINKDFLHASNTEEFLVGKSIYDKDVIREALNKLDAELRPDHVLPDYSPEFRKLLAEGLFYKFILSVKPENTNERQRSGATILERGLSWGKHEFQTDKSLWPVTEPLPKIESIHQTSGEAQYVNDLPPIDREVYCAFVLTTVANGKVENIDTSEAMKMDGVIAFYTAKDIPGQNLFISQSAKLPFVPNDEVLFVDKEIEYAGQPIGVIAATTFDLANRAASKVRVTYSDFVPKKMLLSIEDVIASKDESRLLRSADEPAKTKGNDVKHVVEGVFRCGGQYHFTMETQCCVCIPVEDGIDVYSATQWIDLMQISIANCLNVKNNSLNIVVRRLGGGFGAKMTRAAQIAAACALVSHLLNRPARFVMTIEANMSSIGKRRDTRQEYKIGVNDDGRIQYLNSTYWGNGGSSFNEMQGPTVINAMQNCYDSSTWSRLGYEVKTDLPSNTYCRAPGTTEGCAIAENMMEHIAKVVGKDPLQVRYANMLDEHKQVLQPMMEDLMKYADYDTRKRAVETFNNENRWKKKGISLMFMQYPLVRVTSFYAHVSVYARDGTVSVTHGGIECGQGINTKVAQIAAHTLGIDLSLVTVKPTNNLTAPNNMVTGGSVTSESCAYATLQACKVLLERLEPIRQQLGGNPSWRELLMTAYDKYVDLCARWMYTPNDKSFKTYSIYGVAITEVQIDVLNGQHVVERVDILEDCGRSINPDVDLGQVEGSFIMGMGFWTIEDLIYDPSTGQLTNNRTWNYKPPGAKDIPVDFRVYFRQNAPNNATVLRSKATGEPPLCLSYTVPIAIRYALDSARKDAGNNDPWYQLDAPLTTEKILLSSLTSKEQMVY